MKKFSIKIISYLCILLTVVFIYLIFGWNSEDKFINRMYFTFVTFSTAGYGDISPKSKKLITCTIAFITINEIMNFILYFMCFLYPFYHIILTIRHIVPFITFEIHKFWL
jgi:hypothetical protein